MSLPPLTVGSACFGIGGLDLGLAWAGMTTVWLVEIDKQRREWARQNFSGAKQYDDLRHLDATGFIDLCPVDVFCAGDPCQPSSLAGERKGPDDDRWLWPETVRLVATLRPAWVLLENPAGFITMALDSVLSDLEGHRYTVWPIVIPACAVAAPHIRDRVFILGHTDEARLPLSEQCPKPGTPEPGGAPRAATPEPGEPPFAAWDDAQWITCRDGKSRAIKPGLDLLAHGVPGRMAQISGYGDAVVPHVGYEIGRAIMAAHYGVAA